MVDDAEQFVKDTLTHSSWHMECLHAVRDIDLPDWAIGAGFVRNAVWDRLHGFTDPTPLADIDVLFFDPQDVSHDSEREIECSLTSVFPARPWSVRNQARMHIRNGDLPYGSMAHALSFWLETPTCVAVRLEESGGLRIFAPFGLGELALGTRHAVVPGAHSQRLQRAGRQGGQP